MPTPVPADPVLASNLDELLRDRVDPSMLGRYVGRYDILFRKGNAQLLVSVFFESRTFEVGGNAPVAARDKQDVWDAASLFASVRDFLSSLSVLGVKDMREVSPVHRH